jgi:DNA-binding MarR family transcriptional regulator
VGVALWHAAQAWKAEFDRRMINAGFEIFGQAASNALAWIGPSGVTQSSLARHMGISKQAAQQFVDTLQEHGLVVRQPDPADARAHRVVLTAAGKAMMAEANGVKTAIEAGYRDLLGDAGLQALKSSLARLKQG